MKKLISIILMISLLLSMLLISSNAREDYGLTYYLAAVPVTEEDVVIENYRTCDQIQSNIEENINNYFLPVAYDVSPLTVREHGFNLEKFFENSVVYDKKDMISVPPIYTAVAINGYDVTMYGSNLFEAYVIYNAGNKNNMEMTDTMWRMLNQYSSNKYSSLDSAINAFIAPWTLYNDGGLYTWPELMEMSEYELSELDFDSYEFFKFISNVKEALLSRGWWKDEYQEKYDILNAHRNDYLELQPQNEILTINGNDVYLSRINQEYFSSELKTTNNIISVNIYDSEFAEALSKIEAPVRTKYSEVITAIEKQLSYDEYEEHMQWGRNHYRDPSATEFAPNAIACENNLLNIWYMLDVDDSEVGYQHMMLFAVIEECNVPKEKIRETCERYNYIIGELGALQTETIDMIVNGSNKERIDYFKYDTSVVVSYDPIVVIPWNSLRLSYDAEGTQFLGNSLELDLCDDYQRFFNTLEEVYDNSLEKDKAHIREYIDYVKNLYGAPETGENTVLYIAIAGAAVVCMTALLVRKKKEIE